MTRMRTKGFTLIELLVVVAIMGLMGSLSVSGFRAMRRGMEQRSILRNVSQFIRNAYQRAEIDRQTTAVFFWNEVRRDETDDRGTSSSTEVKESVTKIVVGRAVAVRLSGRVSAKSAECIFDEFGDLRYTVGKTVDTQGQEEEDEEVSKNGARTSVYRMSGDAEGGSWDDCRHSAGQMTIGSNRSNTVKPFLLENVKNDATSFTVYGYYLPDGTGDWEVGDQYGFEIAELTLPNNYIFGSNLNVSKIADGPQDAGGAMWFYPQGETGRGSHSPITISSVSTGSRGELEAHPFSDKTEDPTRR